VSGISSLRNPASIAFAPTSRYAAIAIAKYRAPDGTEITYLRRRFIPSADRFAVLQLYTVVQGDRLDNITARFLGDPLQFWRICDANAAMRPDELTERIGRQVRITLPEGIPSVPPT
jgi:nucleoid-associated protein YgaU